MMKSKKLTAFFILFTYFCTVFQSGLCAQAGKNDRVPEPYGIDEFKTWQKDLRRFEIISFGALPFVTLFSFLTYDIIRSLQHRGDPAYAPWPVKNPETAVPFTEAEQKGVFFASLGISVGIALIDLSIQAIKRSSARKKQKLLEKRGSPPIELIPIEDGESAESVLKKETSKTDESAENTVLAGEDGSGGSAASFKESESPAADSSAPELVP